MQNHQQHNQEAVPAARKPPRPPPISISQPPNPYPSAPPEHRPPSSDFDSPVEKPLPPQPPVLPSPTKNAAAGAIVAVEKFYSPLTSPLPATPPNDPPPHHHQIVRYKAKEAAPPQSGGGERKGNLRFGHADGGMDNFNTGRPSKKENVNAMSKVALGTRVFEVTFCLVSFAVMATNKTQGWTGDSFGRYKEYRFCLAVNIIGFVYAGFQTVDLAYHLATGDHIFNYHLRYQFDFVMDQARIMAYLLISASSSAATRVVDWELNWGKDEFTEKASASISMAFLAFLTFAMSSLISGYNLCTCDLS
ncbi:hypothetical protein Cgig2_030594 [Carnegiea gigantea]|uniref:CASP-like protein n=1 Tax=Carnegiea gigantea TaxID=171969 RepID=A0A9Q1GY70_9CARY|nr:hypothetical protein Cgig2_030594 [Carnegiea gigantea]